MPESIRPLAPGSTPPGGAVAAFIDGCGAEPLLAGAMNEAEIICERQGCAGVVVLNRPAALNALTLGMVRGLSAALEEWERDPAVSRVVIAAAGDKAFSAGGDIRALYEQGRSGKHAEQRMFWREEYTLNVRIRRYPKPIVALIDGIVMGGGVGVSVHARHRVAGDRYLFAMPEAGIGFFPDVGATYFLPRLPGRIGIFMALTGHRVQPGDAVALGLASAYVPSARMADIAEALRSDRAVDETIAGFAAEPPWRVLMKMDWIEWGFAPGSPLEIVRRLEAAAGEGNSEAAGALGKIRRHAPLSLAIAARQMRLGRQLDFEAAMQTEFRIVWRVCVGHDFYEGVRALIVDKDNRPAWQPSALEDVRESEVDAYFASLGENELRFDAGCRAEADS